MDWPDYNSCIKCDKGGKKMLVCSEDGCPLVVHKKCLGCPVRVDDAGRFYCPYCLYKKAVAESRKARENALARKKALVIFMDVKAGENKTHEDNGHNQSESSDTNVHPTSCGDGKSKSNNDGIIDQPSPHGEGKKISDAEEDSEASAGSKGRDPSPKLNGGNANGIAEQVQEEEREASAEEQIQEEEHENSAEEQIQEEEREASADEQIQEEERETSVEEEQIQEEQRETSVEEEETLEGERETSSASTNQDSLTMRPVAKKGSKKSKPAEKDSEVAPQSKLLKQKGKKQQASPSVTPAKRYATRSSPAKRTGKVVNEEFSPPRKLKKPEESSNRLKEASQTFGSAKRKRLMWTAEEEETLREGVRRHSKEGNAKLPWRKILEEDSNKFDPTRTPGDLKDKWRNIVGR